MRRKIVKRIAVFAMAVLMASSQMTFTAKAAGTTPGMDGAGIVIDGYYDDWESVPKTEIDWGYREDDEVIAHEGAMLRIDDMVYVYFKASIDYGDKPMQKYNLRFKVNGTPYDLHVVPIDANGNKQWDSNPNLPDGNYTSYAVYMENRMSGMDTLVGDMVSYTVTKDANGKRTEGDRIEFAMDINTIAKIVRAKPDAIREMAIQNLYFGSDADWIVSVGDPTYAVLFFLIALPMVMAGVYKYSKSKNKKGLM